MKQHVKMDEKVWVMVEEEEMMDYMQIETLWHFRVYLLFSGQIVQVDDH